MLSIKKRFSKSIKKLYFFSIIFRNFQKNAISTPLKIIPKFCNPRPENRAKILYIVFRHHYNPKFSRFRFLKNSHQQKLHTHTWALSILVLFCISVVECVATGFSTLPLSTFPSDPWTPLVTFPASLSGISGSGFSAGSGSSSSGPG